MHRFEKSQKKIEIPLHVSLLSRSFRVLAIGILSTFL